MKRIGHKSQLRYELTEEDRRDLADALAEASEELSYRCDEYPSDYDPADIDTIRAKIARWEKLAQAL